MLCLLFLAGIGVCVREVMLRGLASPAAAVDDRGVWLTRGRYDQQGLSWDEIAAAGVVTDPAAPGTAVPYPDLYPTGRAAGGDGPLDRRVATADPAAPGLRGRRYAIGLTGGTRASEGGVAPVRGPSAGGAVAASVTGAPAAPPRRMRRAWSAKAAVAGWVTVRGRASRTVSGPASVIGRYRTPGCGWL
ncbi:hypothetical protein ACWGJZ_18800, partial [Streptomyces rimosus]